MSTFAADVERFERALTIALPESRAWARSLNDRTESWRVELTSLFTDDSRKLSIELHDGEIDIGFYVGPTGVGRAPYELNAPMPDEHEPVEALVNFVAALVEERLVLVMRRGWARGGRDFLPPDALTPKLRPHLEWVASWRGTFDWAIPRV